MLWVLICVHFVGETMRENGWTQAYRKGNDKKGMNKRKNVLWNITGIKCKRCLLQQKTWSKMCKKFENRFSHGRYIRITGHSWAQDRMNRVQILLQYYKTKICWKKPTRIASHLSLFQHLGGEGKMWHKKCIKAASSFVQDKMQRHAKRLHCRCLILFNFATKSRAKLNEMRQKPYGLYLMHIGSSFQQHSKYHFFMCRGFLVHTHAHTLTRTQIYFIFEQMWWFSIISLLPLRRLAGRNKSRSTFFCGCVCVCVCVK